jgi:hypothetical protein
VGRVIFAKNPPGKRGMKTVIVPQHFAFGFEVGGYAVKIGKSTEAHRNEPNKARGVGTTKDPKVPMGLRISH